MLLISQRKSKFLSTNDSLHGERGSLIFGHLFLVPTKKPEINYIDENSIRNLFCKIVE